MNGRTTLRRFAIPAFRIRAGIIRGALIRAALPALAGALVLAGCGGSGGSGGSGGTLAAAGATASCDGVRQAERVPDVPEAAWRNGQAGAVRDPAARVLLARRLPVRIAAPEQVLRRPGFGRVQGLR